MPSQRNHIDFPLLLSVLLLMLLSLGIVYSASATWALQKFGESSRLLNAQVIKVLIGIGALFIGIAIDYKFYRKVTKLGLIVAVALLAVTLILGGELKGATRWLRIGPLSFQPSEFAKFALLFHLSALIASKGETIRDFKVGYVPMMIWIGLVSVLVLLQPNFSTGAMMIMLSLIMLLISRARFLHLAGTALAAVPLLALYLVLAPYRLARIRAFLESGFGGESANYQLWQGIIGFGNGGLFGVGPGESKQRDLFLPESFGDFVFSIVGEEYGLVGTIAFMGLFLLIMLRGFKIARYARDEFGQTLAAAITSAITLYAVINAGVTLGLLPTTGLPMPFVSYGGSSLVFSSFAVGVLLNISAQTDLHPRASQLPEGVVPLQPLEEAQGKA
jgi:cell division protein FtsW